MKNPKNPRNAGRKQKGYYQRSLGSEILRCAFPYQGKYVIYGLASTATPHMIQYIGYTSMALNLRYNLHISQTKGSSLKECWVREVLEGGHQIVMILLEEGIATREGACLKEQQYIQQYGNLFPLKNSTKGGIGTLGMIHRPESRRKQSLAHQGMKYRRRKKPTN